VPAGNGARSDRGRLVVDRLPEAGSPLEVVRYEGANFGDAAARGAREPHRHDYHELIWTRAGEIRHRLDGEPLSIGPHTITLIGRGQVHVLERAVALHGAVVRFGEELLHEVSTARTNPAWLLAARAARTVTVPHGDVERLEATIATLDAEVNRPADACSIDLQRHLLSALLLWIERWYDATRTEQRATDDAAVQLHRRFTQALERDFARHHEAGHYADALAVPPATLSRALAEVTGRTTKELITDRVMLEAARLLRFHGPHRQRGRLPRRLHRPALLLTRVQAASG